MTYQPDEPVDEPSPDVGDDDVTEYEPQPDEASEAEPQPDYYQPPIDQTAEELRGLKFALAEERRRNRDLAENVRRDTAERAVLNERLTQLDNAVRQANAPKPAPAPDREQDPVGWMAHQVEMQNRVLQGMGQYVQNRNQEAQAQAARQQWAQAVQAREYEFLQEFPDYHNALTHLRREYIGDLQAAGYTPQQAVQMTTQQEIAVAQQAMQLGENPAARLYALAQRRGYGQSYDQGNGDAYAYGGAGGYAPEQPASEMVTQTFARHMPDLSVQAAGEQEAATLGSVGGSGGGRMPSLKALANMDKAEFAEYTKGDNWKKLWS